MATIIRRINSLRRCKAVFNQSEIQNLSTTSIEIVPSPGAGKAIHINCAFAYLNHNGTSYTGGGTIGLGTNTTYATRTHAISSVIAGTSDNIAETLVIVGGDGLAESGIWVSAQSAASGAGGTITVVVFYTIFDI